LATTLRDNRFLYAGSIVNSRAFKVIYFVALQMFEQLFCVCWLLFWRGYRHPIANQKHLYLQRLWNQGWWDKISYYGL